MNWESADEEDGKTPEAVGDGAESGPKAYAKARSVVTVPCWMCYTKSSRLQRRQASCSPTVSCQQQAALMLCSPVLRPWVVRKEFACREAGTIQSDRIKVTNMVCRGAAKVNKAIEVTFDTATAGET